MPLFVKEIWEVFSGRALWVLLLLLGPLVGYSFFQAVSLYAEASSAARDSPVLASGLSPLDGILVPTLGAFYVMVTLLFPFVAIRVLGQEKESGALRLLAQLPYRASTVVAVKLAAVALAWLLSLLPVLSTLGIWALLGGHLYLPETLNLLLGHLLYGLLIGAIALFAAAVAESAATAAIIALAFTIGSWVLDFTAAGRPGLLDWLSRLSLTQTLRSFERGLFSAGLVMGMTAIIVGFCALCAIWLPPGVPFRLKFLKSGACVIAVIAALFAAAQIKQGIDVTEDRRNSFPAADQRALAQLQQPLVITVHLAPEDPRYTDLQRNVLSKLQRTLPHVTVRLAGANQTVLGSSADEAYGEVEYVYGGRSAKSRSSSHREILPVLYELADVPPPTALPSDDYSGYPLVADAEKSLLWFFGALPLLILIVWWRIRRPPRIHSSEMEVSHAAPIRD
jgi:hypothetical protein